MRKLTAKQQKFIEEYIEYGKGAAAAREAGYKSFGASMGYRLLDNDFLVLELDKLLKEKVSREFEFLYDFAAAYEDYMLSDTQDTAELKRKIKLRIKTNDLIRELYDDMF
jgi:phage terminase small subunit